MPSVTAPPAKHLRILYVEDDPVLRDLFATKLSHLGMVRAVMPCANARDAMSMISGTEVDVALLDLNLGAGQINGIDLGLALRAVQPELPIVIFSQHSVPRVENVVPAKERHSWSFVQKHGKLDITHFAAVIERTVAGGVDFGTADAREGFDDSPLGRLSRRQRQVMALAAAGYDAKAIAERLHMAHVSVRRELSQAYRVLVPEPGEGTDLRTVAVLEFMRLSAGTTELAQRP
ncbi:MAG: response regulator [Thermoleophilia bacterium]